MDKPVNIDVYHESDKQQVIDLILGIQREEFNIPITEDQQPDLQDVPAFYQRGAGNFWVARYGDKVVGTVSLLDIGHQKAALRKMFVDSAFRGKTYNVAYELYQSLFLIPWIHSC